MPTEREHSQHNKGTEAEIKEDHSSFRLRWLDRTEMAKHYFWAWFYPTGCSLCMISRYIIIGLAIIGIASLIS